MVIVVVFIRFKVKVFGFVKELFIFCYCIYFIYLFVIIGVDYVWCVGCLGLRGWSCLIVVKYWSVYWGVIVSVWGVGGVLVF